MASTSPATSAPTAAAKDDWQAERTRLEQWQSERLREQVAHVVGNSPYWQQRFADADVDPASVMTVEDLYQCPTLTKRDYIDALAATPENYGGLLCGSFHDIAVGGANIYHTTGTSGMQGRFVNSDEGSAVYGRQGAVLLHEAGARPGDAVMLAFPLALWAAGWGIYYGAKQIHVTVVPGGSPIDTAQRIQLLKDYHPAVVALTPSYALTLGTALAEAGVDPSDFGVKGLLMGGETFSPSRRARIEDLWRLPGGTRNFFGISEGGPLFAVECSAQDGLHLFERDTVHQFWVPNENKPAKPGEFSEHVFTSLAQRTMATWFNFRTRDGAVYRDGVCGCGRTSRRMWIQERLDDMVKVRGVNIFASAVEQILSTVSGASPEFRLQVERVDEHDILTVQLEAVGDTDRAELKRHAEAALKTAIGTRLDVAILDTGTLPRTELKARRWLDLRPKD
jgi:phenylacetate-CoA ligase